ncbi:MAG: hypothetical protein ISS70_13500 [Phycisphaerae bacterium]|nr:hypothetical protein [Phycisphaerae bacterium]
MIVILICRIVFSQGASDGPDQEAAKYDERCKQICREMLYVFSQVRK